MGLNTWAKPRSGLKAAQNRFVLSVVIPVLLYGVVLGLFTLGWAFALMFFDYSPGREGGAILGLGGSNPFIGLENFRNMFTGRTQEASVFWISFKNSAIFALMVLPLNLLITLPLAAMIESVRNSHSKNILRAIFFLPTIASSVGVALIWQNLYASQNGLLNEIIRFFGGTPIVWLSNARLQFMGISVAMWAVIIAYLWQDYGYNMIIFIAALQGIPQDLRDAALIDGANPVQVFLKITLPLLRPTLLFVCVMTTLSSFQVFDIIQVMTKGGPSNQTRVLVLDIYENAFRFQRMGWAAATAFMLVMVVMTITIIQMRVLRTDWEY